MKWTRGSTVLVVVAVAASLSLIGSGTVGILGGDWSVTQECTPLAPGDTTGSVGYARLGAAATSSSVFAIDNDAVLTDETSGVWRGNVTGSPVEGGQVDLDIAGKLNFLVADRTVDPVWFTEGTPLLSAPAASAAAGYGVGTIATPGYVKVDPYDNSFFVTSIGSIELPGFVFVDKYLVVKYDAAGNYVTQFGGTLSGGVGTGDPGTANGYFASGFTSLTVAVSPVDGSVAVGDGGNSRVQIFTPNAGRTLYSYSTKVGTNGTGNSQFGGTSRINVAYDSLGALYAGDNGNSRFQKFTVSGTTVTYVTQVALTGVNAVSPIQDMTISSNDILYAAVILPDTAGVPSTPGYVRTFNTSLVAQSALRFPPPAGTDSGMKRIAADATGLWVSWGQSNFVEHYTVSGATATQDNRWYSGYPIAPLVFSNYGVAVKTTGEVVVLFPDPAGATVPVFGRYRVTSFNWQPVPLSDAIEGYMRDCDSTLGGLSYSYDAAYDPNVVLPGWSGDVWSHLKELCTAHGIEIYLDDTVIRVNTFGSRTITLVNNTPLRVEPTNLFGGQQVVIVATHARAGGGTVFDAAATATRFQIDIGQRKVVAVSTANYPVGVDIVIPVDSLPILPGQYYVIDSTGAHVPAAAWSAAGASVVTAIGDSPGQIEFTLQGPGSAINGYAGPFTFADSSTTTATPTLVLTGKGTFTSPEAITFETGANPTKTTNQTARTIRNFAIDTLERLYERAPLAIDDVSGVAVTVTFEMPTADLLGFGRTMGAVFTAVDSKYRIVKAVFGGLKAQVTAVRVATLDDIDTATTGLTVDQRDLIWDGYSVDDRSIKPLALTL